MSKVVIGFIIALASAPLLNRLYDHYPLITDSSSVSKVVGIAPDQVFDAFRRDPVFAQMRSIAGTDGFDAYAGKLEGRLAEAAELKAGTFTGGSLIVRTRYPDRIEYVMVSQTGKVTLTMRYSFAPVAPDNSSTRVTLKVDVDDIDLAVRNERLMEEAIAPQILDRFVEQVHG